MKYLLSLLAALPLVSSAADGEYFTVEYSPTPIPTKLQIGVTHTAWIPPGVKTLRGVIVHQHGCGEGACKSGQTSAYELHWQELARKWDCALLGPSYHQSAEQNCRLWCDPRNGSDDVFIQSLKDLAEKSKHPELATVPWCLWGHSGGGFWASLLQMNHPERIVAIWFQSGTAHSRWVSGEIEAPPIPEEAMGIPMMANPGFKERGHDRFKVAYNGCYAMVRDYRSRGGLISFAPDPRTGHETGDSRYLAIPFFDACLDLRLPDKPGDAKLKPIDIEKDSAHRPLHENYVDPADSKDGGEDETNWFPNETIAVAWDEFIKTGAVGDKTPPPAPTDVTVTGNTVTWNARPDYESGIQAFVILRDGKEFARVPEKSESRFGRPLFQKMSYGDTPSPPLPEMKFVDPDPGNTDHKYRVITVNSAGLRSN